MTPEQEVWIRAYEAERKIGVTHFESINIARLTVNAFRKRFGKDKLEETTTPQNPKSPWQPIETAPKDGTKVIVMDEDGDVESSEWISSYWNLTLVCRPLYWMPMPPMPEGFNGESEQ